MLIEEIYYLRGVVKGRMRPMAIQMMRKGIGGRPFFINLLIKVAITRMSCPRFESFGRQCSIICTLGWFAHR